MWMYVRDHIPISFKLWKKSKATDIDADIVPEIEKEMLWADVKRHFSFLEDKEQLFKDWVMKKMAIAFQTFKKNLNKDYVKKGLTPDLRKTSRINILIGRHSCNTSCPRIARRRQPKPRRMRAKRSTFIILGKEDMRRRFRNGRRWKMISWPEESYR